MRVLQPCPSSSFHLSSILYTLGAWHTGNVEPFVASSFILHLMSWYYYYKVFRLGCNNYHLCILCTVQLTLVWCPFQPINWRLSIHEIITTKWHQDFFKFLFRGRTTDLINLYFIFEKQFNSFSFLGKIKIFSNRAWENFVFIGV